MKEQGLAYGAAMNPAMDDLDRICQESERLKNRLCQLDAVVESLKPLIVLGERMVAEDHRPVSESIEMAAEPARPDRLTPQMVGIAIPRVQRRINSVLGLAVA